MGREENLCEWFKCLAAHKRIDYMCALLRLCLPLELRFLGSVLEDLAKKDFHILRDQENKANQRTDLLTNTSSSLCDKKLRAKVITALALMNSTNSPCAQVIFDIILHQDLDSVFKLLNNSFISADLIMLLTMAVNHPAFTFYQRNQLGQVLERVQRYIGESPGDDNGDADDRNLHVYTSAVPHGCCQFSPLEPETVSEGYVPHCSCEPSHTSANSSPVNSGTSSPSSISSHADNRCRFAGTKTADPVARGPPSVTAAYHTFPPLHVLHLDDSYSSLRDYQQVIHISKEEFTKAGMPPEVEVKLKSKLGQGRSTYMNGVVDPGRCSWTEAPTVLCHPLYHQPLAHINHHYVPHLVHASGYLPLSGDMSVPPCHTQANHGSAASSPPSSPLLQSVAGLPIDQCQSHMTGHVPSALSLHIMSPAGTVAIDTRTVADMNVECVECCSSEDEKPTGYDQRLKYKGHGIPQQSQSLPLINQSLPLINQSLPLINQDTVSLSTSEAATRTSILPAPHTHPAASESGISITSVPPPLTAAGVCAACPHISTSHVGFINGYLSEPPPVPTQGASTVVGPRVIQNSRTLKATQPVHSGLGRNSQAMPLPTPDVQQRYANLPDLHAGLPLPSYIPLASSAHMMALNAANFEVSNTPQSSPIIPPGGSRRVLIAQSPGMPPGKTNCTSLFASTPSHPTDPSTNHSPTPSTAAVYVDQVQASSYIIEMTDPSRAEESSVSPPVQTPGIITSLKSHSNVSSSSSSPSPPLISASHKHTGTHESQESRRAAHVLAYINGLVPVIYPSVGYHQRQQAFPNGLTPEYGTFVRLPHHNPPSHFPLVYSNLPHASTHTTVSPIATNHNTALGTPTHGACYNCGHTGHQVSDCQESRMETVSNTFHLKYSPSDSPT